MIFKMNLQLFGGRGGSSGMGGGGGGVKSVYDDDGSRIDLSETPLKYGEKDLHVTGEIRDKVEEFEERRFNSDREYSFCVDKDGNIVGENRGGKSSVRVPIKNGESGQTNSHIHSREKGVLGGTFSLGDIKVLSLDEFNTVRARAKEGTYSISKRGNFDAEGLIKYTKKFERKLRKEYRDRNNSIRDQYQRGDITYEVAKTQLNKSFNRYLVESHEQFLAGRDRYGYDYTLERVRRKK